MHADAAAIVAHHGYLAEAVTVLVDTPTRLVAKVDTDAGPLVVKRDAAPDAFAVEVAAHQLLGAAGLPVAPVLAQRSVAPAYLVLPWTEGVALSSASARNVRREAGATLRRVHRLGADAAPEPAGRPRYAGNKSWDAWMSGWLRHAAQWWGQAGRADPLRIELLRGWHERLQPLLATRGGDLTLFDGRPEHIRVSTQPGDQHLAGIIDLGEVRAGDAAMDLAVLAISDPRLLPDVLDGYRLTSAEKPVFNRLIPYYLHLRRLAAAEYNNQHGDPALAGQIMALVDQGAI
jgi:Ser/Thr protein kinase RdoA (MazF antagonist)